MTYLSSAVNSMYPLLVKRPPRPEDLIKAASIGCKTLRTLLKDSDFIEHVRNLNIPLTEDLESITQTGRNWKTRLLNELPIFLGEVRNLLVEQQIPTEIVDIICRQVEQMRQPMSDWRGSIKDFLDMIERVRKDICKLQQEIEKNRENPAFLNEARNKLLGYTYMVAGITCIATTAIFLYPDFRNFFLALSSILASTYLSLAYQPPQIPLNLSNQQSKYLLLRRVATPIMLSFVLILATTITIKYLSPKISRPTPTATALTTLASQPLFFDNINASFYTNPDSSNGTFDKNPSSIPIFTQSFPVIEFNPDPSLQHCSKSTGVDMMTRPFTDILQNPNGLCKTIRAQNNGKMAGLGKFYDFEAVFSTSIVVPSKGFLIMQIRGDDGWIVSIGANKNGGKLPSPEQTNMMAHPPADNRSPLYNYPEVGDNNFPSSPNLNKIKVNFPSAGSYPVEIDYTECCGDQLTLVVSNVFTPELS